MLAGHLPRYVGLSREVHPGFEPGRPAYKAGSLAADLNEPGVSVTLWPRVFESGSRLRVTDNAVSFEWVRGL